MTTATLKNNHPYVTTNKNICGGKPIIRNTRIPVWSLIQWYKTGMSIEEVIKEFPQLKPAQIHDTFSFYYDNQKEIEKQIIENEKEKYWQTLLSHK
jgi:type III restriction enzyme